MSGGISMKKELSREELLGQLKMLSVYGLVYMGVGLFVVDGSLYRFCMWISTGFGLNGRYLSLGLGGLYFAIGVIFAIWYWNLFRKAMLPPRR